MRKKKCKSYKAVKFYKELLYYLSLGSNLGERERTLAAAVDLLNLQAGRVIARSAYFYSPAWGYASEHPFCNICICLESALEPLEMLHLTQSIEQQLGRNHKTQKTADGHAATSYQDRTIDIDLLEAFLPETNAPYPLNTALDQRSFFQNLRSVTFHSEQLTLPHPLMHERDFVMIPLHELPHP